MTHSIDTPTSSTGDVARDDGARDVAREEAKDVGQTAAQAGGQVVSTATDQAREVVAETQRQAQDLLGQGRAQLREQAGAQQRKAADGLGSLARELRGMADGSGDGAPGPAHDLVRQASDKVEEFGSWLQNREPEDLLDEVRAYARRKPGTFLLGAAVAGVLVGRLTRGVKAAHSDAGSGAGRPTGAMAGGTAGGMAGGTTGGMAGDSPRGASLTGHGELSEPLAGAAYSEADYAGDNYVDPAPSYSGVPEPHGGYGTTPGTGAPLPPPPYGAVPPAGSVVPPDTPAAPNRRPEEGMDR